MKRLFISLLRVGDLILQKPLIESAGQGGEIHILMNDEFKQAQLLYPLWKFHFFPRQELQLLINRPDTSILAPFENLRNFVHSLNQIHFDEVINCTHNRVSAYLMGQIHATKKRGLIFEAAKFKPFENSWQTFFNSTFSENRRSEVHYLTALAKSLDIEVPRIPIIEDRRHYNTVYLQVLTSDEKKNWSLTNWQTLLVRLRKMRPEWNIRVLCASFEVKTVEKFFSEDEIEVANLVQAREKLKQARLLISGDTSIAHLAAEVRTPTIVLSLGSSDYSKTMPWCHGNWVLTAEVACSPCPHSSKCTQPTHLCGESLRVSSVLNLINGMDRDQFLYSFAYPERLFRMEFNRQYGLRPASCTTLEGQDVSENANSI